MPTLPGRAARLAVAVTLLTGAPAGAQLSPSLDAAVRASAGRELPEALQRGAATRQGDAALAAALRLDRTRLAVHAVGELPLGTGTRPGGRLALDAATPSWRGLRAVVAGVGAHNPWWGDQATRHAAATVQLGWSARRAGAWLGAEAVQLGATTGSPLLVRGYSVTQPTPGAAGPDSGGRPSGTPATLLQPRRVDLAERWSRLGSVGGWWRVGGVLVTAAVRGGRVSELPAELQPRIRTVRDTLTGRELLIIGGGVQDDSGRFARRAAVETELRASWARGRVALTGVAGARRLDQTARVINSSLGQFERTTWGALDATLALRHDLALTASLGANVPATDAAGILAGAPAARPRRFALLGLRVSPRGLQRAALPPIVHDAPDGLDLRRDADGGTVLRVRVVAARVVEVAGDFTAWKAVAMRRVGADAWETTLAIPSGTHRVSIRVDGDRWVAPPGLPPVQDDFGGSAAVVVVP